MKTEIVRISPGDEGSPAAAGMLERAGSIIKHGGIVAFPTETVYGLGGNAFDSEASKKIYAAKGRPSDNPLIVHICRMEDLARAAVDIPDCAYALAEKFWPGPLTMILKKAHNVPAETTGGLDTVAVRFPSHPVAKAFIAAAGGFVAAPSANRSGRPSPTRAEHCIEDLDGRADMIIDGGEVGIGVESSIVDLTIAEPAILRPGYITAGDLSAVLGGLGEASAVDDGSDMKPKAPGMKYRHYAPGGEMMLVTGDETRVRAYISEKLAESDTAEVRTAVISSDESAGEYERASGGRALIYRIGSRNDINTVARNLFGILRQCDADGAERIYSEAFYGDGLSDAVMNRLEKACGHNIVKV